MKNLLTIISILSVSFSTALASTNPEVIIKSEKVDVVTVATLDLFSNATYNSKTDNLVFNTKTKISFVQIYDSKGDLQFNLPVMCKNVQISKNLFGEGSFKLAFKIEGQTEIYLTDVTIR